MRATWFSIVMLAVAGSALLWMADDLMILLLSLIGEDRALGAANVVHGPDGSVLLTNPGVMALWTLPFMLLGMLLLVSSVGLAYRWRRRLTPIWP